MSINIISNAYAAAPAGQAANAGIFEMGLLAVFVLIFYFMLVRPQSKRAKEHKDLLGALQKGDEVITGGGLSGKLAHVTDDFVSLTIAEGVDVKIQKHGVTTVLPKGTLKSI